MRESSNQNQNQNLSLSSSHHVASVCLGPCLETATSSCSFKRVCCTAALKDLGAAREAHSQTQVDIFPSLHQRPNHQIIILHPHRIIRDPAIIRRYSIRYKSRRNTLWKSITSMPEIPVTAHLYTSLQRRHKSRHELIVHLNPAHIGAAAHLEKCV